MYIKEIKGYEILDSRGFPTVLAKVTLSDGTTGMASVPSGASTGEHEAIELRDRNEKRYLGKGVLTATLNINTRISPALEGFPIDSQTKIDETMIEIDGTNNKSNLGANATLAVSLACARAAANYYKLPLYRYLGGAIGRKLPLPMMNILNGGAHASNNIDIQEFMIVPVSASNFHGGLRMCGEVYHTLGTVLKKKGHSTSVGDEGGYAPNLDTDEEAVETILEAINEAGYTTEDIKIALDVASSEWYSDGKYVMPKKLASFETNEMIDYIENFTNKFPIISVEDGLAEDDFESWTELTKRLKNKNVQLVGDDLFVTNQERLCLGIQNNCANAILIKPNQIGTLTETINCVLTAKENGYKTIISHRSGETDDTFISDLAVALNAGQIKTGAPCRMDRVAKYNRLLMIEDELLRVQ